MRNRIVFNPEITWGNIMQLVVMLAAVVVMYADTKVYKERTELRIKLLEKNDDVLFERLVSQASATQKLTEAVIKLNTLVEERTKSGNDGGNGKGKIFIN